LGVHLLGGRKLVIEELQKKFRREDAKSLDHKKHL